MRNCEIILAFLISYCVASFVTHEGDKFIAPDEIHSSSNGTFFWVHTFKLGETPGCLHYGDLLALVIRFTPKY